MVLDSAAGGVLVCGLRGRAARGDRRLLAIAAFAAALGCAAADEFAACRLGHREEPGFTASLRRVERLVDARWGTPAGRAGWLDTWDQRERFVTLTRGWPLGPGLLALIA